MLRIQSALIALCFVAHSVPAWAQELRLGRGQVKITPPPGMPMGGGFTINLSTGVHDDLFCKALLFEQGSSRAGIVSCDVESLHRPTVVAARARIDETCKTRGRDVMLVATHSHSGPEMTPLVLEGAEGEAGRIAREYHEALPQKIAKAVSMAESSLMPARVSTGVGREDSISFNRRFLMKDGSVRMNPGQMNPEIVKPMGPIDPTITVAYFEDADQKPLATQVNFALHATCWGGRDFSADYPGVMARLLGEVKGPSMMTQFLQGASGNLNQVDVTSKRRHFGAEITNRVGTILAAETLRTYSKLEDVSGEPLRVFSEIVRLPVPEFTADDVKQAKAVIERSRGPQPGRPAFLELVHAFTIINVTGRHQSKPLEAEVQVITLGDKVAWVGLPGEVFVELGMAVRAASPFQYTLISELANDMFDYFPDRKAFDQGGYEVVTARAKAGCGEMLVDAARRLLAEAYRNQPGARYHPGFPGK